MDVLNRILALCTWSGVGLLIVLLYRIARFYQITAGKRSHYRWFVLPLVLFVLAGIRFAWIADFASDFWGDGLLFLAGSSLFLFGYYLLDLMMGERQ